MTVRRQLKAAQSGHSIPPEASEHVLAPFTLRFRKPADERAFRDENAPHALLLLRVGIVLAALIHVLFSALDLVVAYSAFDSTHRTLTLAGIITVLAASFQPVFIRHRELLMTVFTMVLGLGIVQAGFASVGMPPEHRIVALPLLIIGAFTILGLRFLDASLVCTTVVAAWIVVAIIEGTQPVRMVVLHGTFLVATLIVAAMVGYVTEWQRRMAHHRRRTIERVHAENRYAALHDPLTGLPNRRLFMERLEQAVARDGRFQTHAAVLFIDIDDFKPVNDMHGHAFGDQLLRAIGARLLKQVRLTDTVARLGGDEFVVLLEDLPDVCTALVLQERMRESFLQPFEVGEEKIYVSLSVGMALHPVDATDPRHLLEAADSDMYRMKQEK